jgi:hypothetical protein
VDGRRAPRWIPLFGPRARWRDPFSIERFSDLFQGSTAGCHLKNALDDRCLTLIYLKLYSALDTHVAIPEAVASGVKPA